MLDHTLSLVNSASAQAGMLAFLVEAVLRLVKTERPLSIAHLIAGGLHKIADICAGLANLLDKVLPQNLK
ncbi:hypothetical protein EBZ39_05665 [bacterium]|nr:hypothetical protein [bacterium]